MNAPLEELACLYVLDRLDPSERVAFEARLLRDAPLTTLVRELETAISRSVRSLPESTPPARLLARIESRIDRLPAAGKGASARPRVPRWRLFAQWGLAAAIAVGVGAIAVQDWRHSHPQGDRPLVVVVGFDSLGSTLAELPMQQHPANADDRFIQLASLAERYWEKPEELPVKRSAVGPSGRGYAIFDPGSSQGFVGIRHLPAIGDGKRYHLWMLDASSDRVQDAGALPLTGSARGLYFFSIARTPETKPERLHFFVTAEEAVPRDSVRPQGEVVLGESGI